MLCVWMHIGGTVYTENDTKCQVKNVDSHTSFTNKRLETLRGRQLVSANKEAKYNRGQIQFYILFCHHNYLLTGAGRFWLFLIWDLPQCLDLAIKMITE